MQPRGKSVVTHAVQPWIQDLPANSRVMSKEAVSSDESVINRLYCLPVITETVGKVSNLYTQTKSFNVLLKLIFETAETGMGLAAFTAKPVLLALEKPIGALNNVACNQLDKLVQDYPIISKPASEVIKETRNKAVTVVKPLSDRLQSVTDRLHNVTTGTLAKVTVVRKYTLDKYTAMVSLGSNKVNSIKSFVRHKITVITDVATHKISLIIDMETCRLVIGRIDLLLNDLERRVYHWLPPVDYYTYGSDECKTIALTYPLISRLLRLSCFLSRRGLGYVMQKVKGIRDIPTSKLRPSNMKTSLCNTWCSLSQRIVCIWCGVIKSTNSNGYKETEGKLTNVEKWFISVVRRIVQRAETDGALLIIWMRQTTSSLIQYVPKVLKKSVTGPWNHLTSSMRIVSNLDGKAACMMYYSSLKTRTLLLISFVSDRMTPDLLRKSFLWMAGGQVVSIEESENKEADDSYHSTGKCCSSDNNSDHYD